ncbi:MAG: hypothetical protein JRN62_02950 [Nitrososphaerota archaeon]|jgi:hypothetical protein|nr:hypothetical protein [Nitrososphaerota archaeon]MDG6948952.1 hypothetical protein [Nitrososphaerota archaeon]
MANTVPKIYVDQFIEQANKSGINVFRGSPPHGLPSAFWNTSHGTYKEFVAAAKADNAKILYVDYGVVTNKIIDALKNMNGTEKLVAELKGTVGDCTSFLSAWTNEQGIAFIYVVETELWDKVNAAVEASGQSPQIPTPSAAYS